MSRYQAAWDRLKRDKKVNLRVAPLLVARYKKAIIKRKDEDRVFKLNNEHDYVWLVISYDKATMTLTFILKQKLGITELVV